MKEEVELYKSKLTDPDRVVLFNPQVSENDWNIYNDDDTLTIVITQILAKIPHITIPVNPDTEAAKAIDMLGLIRTNMLHWQNYLLLVSPHMNIAELEKLINYAKNDKFFLGLMVVGKTPAQIVNLRAYILASRMIPDDRLLIAVNVNDKFGQTDLPTQMAFRHLNFDITCRYVVLDMSPKSFGEGYKKSLYDRPIYIDNVAGLLDNSKQMKWTGKSATDVLADFYSLRDGIDYPELTIAFNFVSLNQTGAVEAQHIMQKTHKKYIESRPLLETFVSSLVEMT